MTICADKYAVRDYISKKIGDCFLNELYGVYTTVDDIDLSSLPKSFVLKPSHTSGNIIICKNKDALNWKKESRKMREWLKDNLYYFTGEWCYKDIPPRIICERLLDDSIVDYKIMCFNGEPKCSFICFDRQDRLKINIYDLKWKRLPVTRKHPTTDFDMPKPKNYKLMLEISRKLSKDFPFVRVDFYEVNGKLYFGELTFFPGNGMEQFFPSEWDSIFGGYIELPNREEQFVL
jgi:hypothetical protein